MHFPGTAGFAVLDLETTGFSPRTERIVEVAVVHVCPDGVAGAQWSTLVHPGRPTVGATHVHGIRADDVRGAPRFAEVVPALVEVLAGRVLVAHNASFDVPFLRAELERAGVLMPEVPQLCTLAESRRHLPHLLKRRLADCCAAAGVQLTGAHSALGDARATAQLLATYLRAAGPGAHAPLLRMATTTPWPAVAAPASAPRLLRRGAMPAVPAAPLPSLSAGDAVVFTGGDPDVRALLEARCRQRGLRVTSAVSRRTVLLVTDDVHSGTRKAARALELGTPVADTATAAVLIETAQAAAQPAVQAAAQAGVVDLRPERVAAS